MSQKININMDQFEIELEHGEIALDLTDADNEQADAERFSPRHTRSGRVYDSSCLKTLRQRRRSQESFRSRNSSGQSAGGSSDINCEYEETALSLNMNTKLRCRLDLSDHERSEEIAISPSSAFIYDSLLSPKKYQQVF